MSQRPVPLPVRYVPPPWPTWHSRWGWPILAVTLLLALAALSSGCAGRQTAPPCSTPPHEAPAPASPSWMDLLWDAVLDAIPDIIRWLVDEFEASRQPPAAGPRFGLMLQRSAAATASAQLDLVRRWQRPASNGQRVRLAAGVDGQLLVAWPRHLGGRHWEAVLERADGTVLEHHRYSIQRTARHHPALVADGHLLVRADDKLIWGGEILASGKWESYSMAGGVAIAWQPCSVRPCPGEVLRRDSVGWSSQRWPVELFGVDMALAGSATATVRIASREQPNSSGWTLRTVPLEYLKAGGIPGKPIGTWRPPRGLALEDPLLVRGGSTTMIVGTAYDLAADRGSGRLFFAEQGGALRELGRVAATDLNGEIGAAQHAGTLYVAAELGEARSGLWVWRDDSLELAAEVPGGAPSLAVADGALWMSSTDGLWRLEQPQ